MKQFSNTLTVSKIKKSNPLQLLITLVLILNLSACELIPNKIEAKTKPIPTYGDYYLWLKTLNNDELLQEIEQQKKNKDVKSPDAEIYVMLLHSLPKSPIYNPYTAKSLLNNIQLQYVESRYNPTNLALITLLRDLLNEQLLTFQKYDNLSVDFRASQRMLTSTQEESKLQEQKLIEENIKIRELQEEVDLLKEQINQLHRIEKNINEHGK